MQVSQLPADIRKLVTDLDDAKGHLAASEHAYFNRRENSWTKEATIDRLRRDYSMAMLDYASARIALCAAMDDARIPARWLTRRDRHMSVRNDGLNTVG